MLRISTGAEIAKYRKGNWYWNDELDHLAFRANLEYVMEAAKYLVTGGYRFLKGMDELEELIFRQEFQRDSLSYDSDVILIRDIVDLVLFLAPPEIVTKKMVHFLNTKTVSNFLHALIIYFAHYLRIVEFVLIRRDEISGKRPSMQTNESTKIKQVYSAHLSQYRLLVAREYSKIVLGQGTMKPFHHYMENVRISDTLNERPFHEAFLAFSTHVVWISMHRRAYDIIAMEMNRLFRSEHFSLLPRDVIQFSETEKFLLYGKNYKRINYRAQNSPIVQEIMHVSTLDMPILWIGEHKYRGTDLRIIELEMEYIVPSSQLVLINVVHGILGHPKKYYNTLLNINWNAVRKDHYSESHDPYNLVKQPRIKVPQTNAETIRKYAKDFGPLFKIVQYYDRWDKHAIQKWLRRDAVIAHFKTVGMLTDVIVKCNLFLEEEIPEKDVEQIRQNFIARILKLQKKY